MGREKRRNLRWRLCRLGAGMLAVVYLALSAGAALGEGAGAAVKSATGGPAASPAEAPKVVPAPPSAAGPGTSSTAPVGDGKIEFHAKNEDLNNVLELLSRQYELNIVAGRAAKGKVTVDLYKVTVDQVLDAICRSSGLSWIRENGSIYVHSPEEMMALRQEESRLTTEIFTLSYLSAEDASKLIAPALSTKGSMAINIACEKGLPSGAGGGTGGNSLSMADTLVVRDFPENMAAIRKIIEKMDRRPRQVLVEATILQVILNDKTSLGVDFNSLAGIDFRDLSKAAAPVVDFPILDPTSVPNDAAVTAPVIRRPWGSVRTEGFATPGTGLNIGVITNNVAFFISALESVKDTTVLSNPKVLALNKQRAEVIVGDRLGYRTTTTTATTTIETIEFLNTGTTLLFRPFISDDGYVRLEIHPKVSTGNVVGGLPSENTTEVTCNIMVKDGHTVVIGGMFDETVGIGRAQVPGLGNIPGLGWLFRNNDDSTVRKEIIVLLTPHILDDEEASNALGEQTLEDSKRRCLGLREGFTFFTRERITAGYMQEADKAWQRYQKTGIRDELDKAWWNVALALNVAPNNLKALRMKDKILSERSGEPFSPPNWTVWDSIRERLKTMDKVKAKAAEAEKTAVPPVAPKAPPGKAAVVPAMKEAAHAN